MEKFCKLHFCILTTVRQNLHFISIFIVKTSLVNLMSTEDMRAQVLWQYRKRGMHIWNGYAADRYWCHCGITPPPLQPTLRTTAYPDESVVVDLGEKFMPPVDQLTYTNMLRLKEEEEVVKTFKNSSTTHQSEEDTAICPYTAPSARKPPSPASWDVWKEGEQLISAPSHGWQPTRHNHTLTRYHRINAKTDDWGRINT